MTNKIKFSLKLFGAGDVVNTLESVSAGSDLTAEMKVFYDKALIELATPNLVHDQFGQKRSIPKNGGRSVEFRCFSRLPKATKAITEGVTPSGSKLNVTSIVCTPEQYGDYVELSDVFELASVDNTIVEATKKLADQAGRTLDTIVRNELSGGTNVMFCPAVDANGTETEITKRTNLKRTSNMTVKQVFKAAAELKAMNAPKIDGYYVGIIHPYVAYDLMQDAGDSWQNVSEYAKPEERFIGEIGRVAGVRFVESTEAKIFENGNIGGYTELAVSQSSRTKPELTVEEALENIVYENPVMITVDGITTYVTEVKNNTLILTDVISKDLGMGEPIYCTGGTSDGHSVFSTVILGADAYGVTEMEGGIENIIKQKGYGNDPLNQRSSVGWKAFKCAKRLVEEYMIRIESVSAFAPTAKGN